VTEDVTANEWFPSPVTVPVGNMNASSVVSRVGVARASQRVSGGEFVIVSVCSDHRVSATSDNSTDGGK